MPALKFTSSVAAGATYFPLDNWQYQYAPYKALLEVFENATAVGMVNVITAGSDTVQEECPVSAGGTAGVLPARLNAEPVTDKVDAGDLLKLKYRNTTGGAITVNGVVLITPL